MCLFFNDLAHALLFVRYITLKVFNMNHFNICSSCINSNSCALTTQKEKVWSCSEYDEIRPHEATTDNIKQPVRELELV